MTDVPRRLPPTQEERVRNVVRTRAALSGQGRTSGARPVQQSRPTAMLHTPQSGAFYDRFTVQWVTTDLVDNLGHITSWDGDVFDSAGTSIGFNPGGDDGGIRLFAEGVYGVTLTLNVQNIQTVDSSVVVAAALGMSDRPDTESIATSLRGGTPSADDAATGTASTVFYSLGRGAANAGMNVYVAGRNLDVGDVGRVFVTVVVQRIT